MNQQLVNIGAAPNDPTADNIRVGGDKINDNFTELYDAANNIGKAVFVNYLVAGEVADLAWFAAQAYNRGFTVSEKQTPLLLTAVDEPATDGSGSAKWYSCLFMGGAGRYGVGYSPIPTTKLYLLAPRNLTPEDLENDPDVVIEPLDVAVGENFIDVANASLWTWGDSGEITETGIKQYYFSYEKDGELVFAYFKGTAGSYGAGATAFTDDMFVITTKAGVLPEKTKLSEFKNDGDGKAPFITAVGETNYDVADNTGVLVTDGLYNNCPTIEQTIKNTVVVFFGQDVSHEGTDNGVVKMIKSYDEGKTYTEPKIIVQEAGYDVRGIGSGVSASGRVFLFYSRRQDNLTVSQGFIYSDDDCVTWSEFAMIETAGLPDCVPYGRMVNIGNGRLMKGFYGNDGTNFSQYVVFSDNDGKNWGAPVLVLTSTVNSYTETDFVYIPGGIIIGIVRRDGGHFLTQVVSLNNGAGWTNQGAVSFGIGGHVSPYLTSYKEVDGELYLVCFFADRFVNTLNAIVGKASDVISGVSGWNVSTLTTLYTSGILDFGYPAAINPKQGKKHLVVFYDGVDDDTSNIRVTNFTANAVLDQKADKRDTLTFIRNLGNESLDTIVKTGIYHQDGYGFPADGYPPDPAAGKLIVFENHNTDAFVYHEYHTFTNKKFIRTKYGTWSAWLKVSAELSKDQTVAYPVLGSHASGFATPFAFAGAEVGDEVIVIPPLSILAAGLYDHVVFSAYVSAANEVTPKIQNPFTSGITVPSATFKFIIRK